MVSLTDMPSILSLKNKKGLHYLAFRKKLKPAFYKVWADIMICFLMMFMPVLFFAEVSNISLTTYILVPLCSLWSAFWIHAYSCFFHEAAHFNIYKNKKINDMISNIIFTPFLGMLVKHYRLSHWEHHKHLGTDNDTEISYLTPLSLLNLIQIITGVFHVKIILRYFRNFDSVSEAKHKSGSKIFLFTLLYTVIVQLLISYIMFSHVSTASAVSWLVAYFIFFPMISNIRQTLEHRPSDSQKLVSKKNFKAVNRIFGTDFFSRYFGAAGFNRHLLHHYDPLISYTNFDELENFLKDTPANKEISRMRATYLGIFNNLLER